MGNIMTKHYSLIAAAILTLVASNVSAREGGSGQHDMRMVDHPKHQRQNFSEKSTRTLANGKTVSRETVQTVNDTGFTRKTIFTTPEGKTGSREVVGVMDKEAGTMTKTITATKPNGETSQHSSTHSLQKGQPSPTTPE
jgi:hypothetical protein